VKSHGRPRETTSPSFQHYSSQIGDRVHEKGGSGDIKGVHNGETALNLYIRTEGNLFCLPALIQIRLRGYNGD
jgi:hypothetical protein